jgi:hypothetical protein
VFSGTAQRSGDGFGLGGNCVEFLSRSTSRSRSAEGRVSTYFPLSALPDLTGNGILVVRDADRVLDAMGIRVGGTTTGVADREEAGVGKPFEPLGKDPCPFVGRGGEPLPPVIESRSKGYGVEWVRARLNGGILDGPGILVGVSERFFRTPLSTEMASLDKLGLGIALGREASDCRDGFGWELWVETGGRRDAIDEDKGGTSSPDVTEWADSRFARTRDSDSRPVEMNMSM